MTYSNSLAALSVYPTAPVANFTVSTAHKTGETADTAINIGNLEEQGAIINLSDQGTTSGVPVSTSLSLHQGDTLTLNASFQNFVDQATTRLQVFDQNGTLLVDNQGDAAQQSAYQTLVAGGYVPGEGTYSVVATPLTDSGAPAIALSSTATQGTTLNVNSQLTGADPTEYYNFTLNGGNNLKLAFNDQSSGTLPRVQVYNSSGALIADSRGDSLLQGNYAALTSGTGLTESPGSYSIAVSYPDGTPPTTSINYNFQLYSGTSYAVNYTTNVTTPAYDGSAAGSVTATSDALLYQRQSYNTIGDTATTGVNVGWLAENKTSLDVQSQLTSVDSVEYYNFTLQTGNNLKFNFANTTSSDSTANLRVQLLNSTGTGVIADNYGTAAQQAAYKALTSSTGIPGQPGQYVVKVAYAPAAEKSKTQTYNFQVYSGTSYAAQYQTIASAQTYGNAVLTGNTAVVGFSPTSAIASYLNSASSGSAPDIISTLQGLF